MTTYMMHKYGPARLHHAYAGYSTDTYTIDGGYHAVDWYWQPPGYTMSGMYQWWVLTDVNEPTQWYRAQHVYIKGTREMEDRMELARL